jgi:cytochrome P450
MLQDRSHLTNLSSYITAVIKDALRLFSSASCTRQENSQTDIIDDQDYFCSTNNAIMWIIHVEMHRASQYWKRPNEFLLKRWLVDENHELYSMKDAWRSFEHESRNCIAQDLVMTKLRVMLALLIQEFSLLCWYENSASSSHMMNEIDCILEMTWRRIDMSLHIRSKRKSHILLSIIHVKSREEKLEIELLIFVCWLFLAR